MILEAKNILYSYKSKRDKNVLKNLLCLIAMPNTSAACVLLSAAAELLTK